MKSELYPDIISVLNLRLGWEKVKSRGGGPGGDGVTLGSFEIGLESRLEDLNRLLASGDYWPKSVRIVDIPKSSGGVRTLRIPSIQDRIVQSAAARILTPILDEEFEDSSFGYRPGRSVQQAARRVAMLRRDGFTWTVDGDIKAFFDNVPHAPLLDRLSAHVNCDLTVDLVERWLEAHTDGRRGLPQGGPISPLLANLHLDAIDEKIEKGGVRLVRFADDFLLLCRSEALAEDAHARMADLLRDAGLEMNPEKTSIRKFEDATRFLGHLFVRGLTLREVLDEEDGLAAPPPAAYLGEAVRPEEDDEEDKAAPVSSHAPRLRWLYVHEPGHVISGRDLGLSVLDGPEGAEIVSVQPEWADGIEVGPGAQIDDSAMRLAMSTRTPVVFVSGDGSMTATLDPAPADRAARHLNQARLAINPEKRAAFACRIVNGRLLNQRALLKRLNRKKKIEAVDLAAHDIGRLARTALIQPSVEEAMGIEGRAAAMYWPALGALLQHGVKFRHRKRRPPPDPVNLTLSYLSTRLGADISAQILRAGLHSGFSCLHATQDGRQNLVLDLIEEFRAPIVESLTVFLFNAKRLRTEEFVTDENHGVRAMSGSIRTMIREYESRLAREVENPIDGNKTNWRGVMQAQILLYIRHVDGGEEYAPYQMDY